MANISATANFAIDTFTLTYAAGTGGSIEGTSLQTVNYGANGTLVTAVPNVGYHFVDWTDGVLDGLAYAMPTSRPTSTSPPTSRSTRSR